MKNMTKRPICILLVAVMLLTLIPAGIIGVSAEEKAGIVLAGETLKDAIDTNQSQVTVAYNEETATATATGLGGVEQFRFIMPETVSGADFPYLAIKYKYDRAYDTAKISLYRTKFEAVNKDGETVNTASNRSQDGQLKTCADGVWHTLVLNLADVQFEGQSNFPAIGGKTWTNYSYNTFTWMPFGWGGVKDSVFSIEYFGFFKTESDAIAYSGENAFAGKDLDGVLKKETNTNLTTEFADNCMVVTGMRDASDAEQAIVNMPSRMNGSAYPYMAIRYKYDKAYDNARISVYATSAISTDGNNTTYNSRTKDGGIETVADGEWQVLIVDMRNVAFENGGKCWANYAYQQLRFLPFGWKAVKDSVFSVSYFGFFSTEEKAVSYVKNMEQVPSVTVSEGVKSIAQYHDNGTFANKINVTWADSTFDRVVLKNADGDILGYSTDASKTATFNVAADGEYTLIGENTSKTYIRGWQPGTDGISIRFVASLDDLNCSGAGMEITAVAGDVTKTFGMDASGVTKTVYGSIKGGGMDYTAADLATAYIHVAVVEGLPTGVEITFTVKPFKMVEGERIYGEETTVVYTVSSGN